MAASPQPDRSDVFTELAKFKQFVLVVAMSLDLTISGRFEEMLPHVADGLQRLKRRIDQVLPLLPLAALVLLVGTGCVFDVNKAMQEWAKPSTSFESPPAWDCTQTQKLPTTNGLQDCTVCRNATRAVQAVTVNNARQGVAPGKAVYLCQTSVMVEGQEIP